MSFCQQMLPRQKLTATLKIDLYLRPDSGRYKQKSNDCQNQLVLNPGLLRSVFKMDF